MAYLIIQNTQVKGFNDTITQVDNKSIIKVLMQYFPDGFNPDNSRLLLNGNEIDFNSDDLTRNLNQEDRLAVVHEVKGIETAILVAVVAVAAVVSIALIPTPEIPNQSGESKTSPNNMFSGQSNIARTYEAFPFICGKIRSYPDLIGEPIYSYTDNEQLIKQYFCIGFGEIDVRNIKIGESLIGGFEGSTNKVYLPSANVATINDYLVGYSSSEIEGQILKKASSGSSVVNYNLSLATALSFVGNNTAEFYVSKDAAGNQLKSDFDAFTGAFNMKVTYSYDSGGEEGFDLSVGSGILGSITDTGAAYRLVFSTFTGDQTNDVIGIIGAAQSQPGGIAQVAMSNEVEELWFNFNFPRGLKSDVDIEIVVEQLTSQNGAPTGFTYIHTDTYTDTTLTPQFITLKLKSELNGLGWYRYSIRRTNNESNDSSLPDEVRIERVQGVVSYAVKSFGDVTLLEINLTSSGGVPTSNNTKVNCDATALMPTNGDLTTRTSRKFADAILHMYLNYYKLPIDHLNTDDLYAIQSRLDAENPELAYFDFSFDDSDADLQQRMETICNAARVSTFLTNGQWQFVRDEKKDFPTGLITGRDIASESRDYSITGGGSNSSDYDGVRLEYVDPVSNTKAYIRKSISNGVIIDGESLNPKTMQLAGCRNVSQARNRAELEIRKLIYQVETLTDTVLPSCSIFDKGDLLLYAEQYESIVADGEILAVSGQTITTSELLTFESGKSYKMYLTGVNGAVYGPRSITPFALSGSYNCAIDDPSNIFVRDGQIGYNIQTGSRYVIVTDSEFEQTKWTLTEKTARGELTQLTMINYDERVYDYD